MINLILLLFLQSFQAPNDNITLQQASIRNLEFGLTTNEVYSRIGRPNSIDTLINEIGDGKEFYQLIYDGITLSIKSGVVEDYDISSAEFELTYESLRVGDPASKIEKLFPKSFDLRYPDDSPYQTVPLTIGGGEYYLLIRIDNDKVVNMYTWTQS